MTTATVKPSSVDTTEESVKMIYRNLGPSGLKVSALSYGNLLTFAEVGEEESLKIMKYLFDNGVNLFDTAEGYDKGNAERILGWAIKEGIRRGYWKRSQLVISTKVFFGPDTGVNNKGLSRKHIIEGLHDSLQRLQLDYVDLFFCHRPDNETPTEEIVRAMNWVIEQGKAFYWGTSEWSAEHIREAHQVADRLNLIHPIVTQPEYSLIIRNRFEVEYAPLYKNPGMGTTIWGALSGGLLSGKFENGIPEDSRYGKHKIRQEWISNPAHPFYKGGFDRVSEVTRKVKLIADEIGCTTAQLAIAWVLKNPNSTTVLMGGKLKYLKENLDSLKTLEKLTPEIMEKIEAVLGNKPTSPFNWKNF